MVFRLQLFCNLCLVFYAFCSYVRHVKIGHKKNFDYPQLGTV